MLSINATYNNYIDYLIINKESSLDAQAFMWTPEECRDIISLSHVLPKHSGDLVSGKIDHKIRKVSQYKIPNTDQTAWIYDKITNSVINANSFFWNYDIDFVETVELLQYSYDPNSIMQDHYRKHSDFGPILNQRKISYSAILSDTAEYQGGDLVFHLENDVTMPKEQGQVIMFPAFQFHSVTSLTKGTRWSLVTWISGRPFR
jgi:PKHD-type hydroxylase